MKALRNECDKHWVPGGCHVLCLMLVSALFITVCGCTTVPYEFGKDINYRTGYRLPENEPQFIKGRPIAVLDASDWYWPGSLLRKLFLWNTKVDSHQISDETVEAVKRYMHTNELKHVKVRINAYSVGNEWRRTFRNKAVGAPWRYTLGFLSWLQYTIMPGRFFGGDHYNPYSNTINLYSDIPSVGLHEAAHSKDFAVRKYKGVYAFCYSYVPLFNLYPEAVATGDALGYLQAERMRYEKKDAYKVLYPAYGTYIGGDIGQFLFFPYNYIPMAAGVLGGHMVGRVNAALVRPEERPQDSTVHIRAEDPEDSEDPDAAVDP